MRPPVFRVFQEMFSGRRLLFFCLMMFVMMSCNQQPKQVTSSSQNNYSDYFNVPDSVKRAGGVKMITIDGKYHVWTKRFGNGTIKVLLLHGGPAITHEYMECFEQFFPQEGIEFYEYDQLGSFYSDQPTDSSLWTVARFVEEVEQVRKALRLDSTNFYLLGNSWGGILAMEYALKYQQHLKGLIVSNMVASIPRYAEYNEVLRSKMRKSLVDSLDAYESKGAYNDSVYMKLVVTEFYNQHICRIVPWPEPVSRSFSHMNPVIYVMMQGPSEFKTGGRLFHWDRWNDLHNITVPALMIGAKYDTMNPDDMEAMSKLVKRGSYLYCPNGSHLAMWDDQVHYYPGVIKFLKDVQDGNFK